MLPPIDRAHQLLIFQTRDTPLQRCQIANVWEAWFQTSGVPYQREGDQLYVHRASGMEGKMCCQDREG